MVARGLASRMVGGVLLCQGLVMAWLTERGQRLPPSLGPPPSNSRDGVWAALPSVHAAQSFLRISSDVVILNSACGEPLRLSGAWQWFDGPLFMHMLGAAERSTDQSSVDWGALLRNDRDLLEVFESLRAYAVPSLPLGEPAGSPSQQQPAERVVQAAHVWERLVTDARRAASRGAAEPSAAPPPKRRRWES